MHLAATLRHLLATCAVATAAVITSAVFAFAQLPAPVSAPAAPAAGTKPAPELICETEPAAVTLSSPGVLPAAAATEHKNWQPVGGQITFTIHSSEAFDPNARILACLKWKTDGNNKNYETATIAGIDLSAADKKTVKVSITVPPLKAADSGQKYTYALSPIINLVPLANVHILIKNPNAAQPVAADTTIGITYLSYAFITVFIVFGLAFGWLWTVVSNRLRVAGFPKVNPFLTIISTPLGYASLAQFQIVLWTFVVLLSAVYVMSLSGELIEITTGTLVLLGISGATTVGSKIYGGAQTPDTTGAPAPGAAVAPAAAVPAVAPAAVDPAHTKPLWSDLITNTTQGKIEIDVARVQMLFFTLVTATFVGIGVITSYVIPEIPNGFQVLMRISNAVYMGSKVAQKP